MFEYIKRVSVAISFIAQKIDIEGVKIKDILETVSLELLGLAQSFRGDKYRNEDLQRLQDKIVYLVDLVDFARINRFVSQMNAQVFIDSQVAFLKHILNLSEQKNSLYSPLYRLKELDDLFARKQAKESVQSKFAANLDFGFSENLLQTQKVLTRYSDIVTQEPKSFVTETVQEQVKTVETTELRSEEKPVAAKAMVDKNVEKEIEARRAKILSILSSGGCSIKEISMKMPDINEKTIQRDLLELMHDKKVIMLGKKRWARYYLK